MAPSEDEAAEVCGAVQLPEMLHMKPAIVETSPTNCVFFSWSHRTINKCYLLLPLKFGSSIIVIIYIHIYIYLALTGSYAWKIRRDSQHGNGTNQNFELDISVRAETMSKSGHPRCLHRNPRAAANATHAAAAAIVRLHSIFRVGRPHRTWVLLELRPNFCAWNGWEVTLRGHMKNSWQKWDDTLYTLDGLNVAMHLLHVGHWRAETSCDQDEPWSWGSKVFAKTSRSRQSSQCIWLPNLESQIHDPIIMDWLALSDI